MKSLSKILFCVSLTCVATLQQVNNIVTNIENVFNQQVQQNSVGIIGGNAAENGEFPFAAAIYTTTELGVYFCGGAIISDQWILTAGHCIFNGVSFRVQVGSNTLRTADENRLVIVANESTLHPDFNQDTLANDVGLIKLPNPLIFNNFTNAISLPDVVLEDYTVATAIGWGQVNDKESGPVDNLNKVTLVTLENEHCKYTYGNQITDNMVCAAGSYNEGTCIGDIGGPLIQYADDRAIHIGIASFLSFNGCESIDPSGYTRTFNYVDWIKSTINA